jgi:hypothetical protein
VTAAHQDVVVFIEFSVGGVFVEAELCHKKSRIA